MPSESTLHDTGTATGRNHPKLAKGRLRTKEQTEAVVWELVGAGVRAHYTSWVRGRVETTVYYFPSFLLAKCSTLDSWEWLAKKLRGTNSPRSTSASRS